MISLKLNIRKITTAIKTQGITVWKGVFNRENSKIFLFVLSLVFILLITWGVIYYHTPKNLPTIIFDFSCSNPLLPCEAKINSQNREDFIKEVNQVIRSSHRLGKLSEIYLSVIRFHVDIKNESKIIYSVPSTKEYESIGAHAQCGGFSFLYKKSQTVENDFVLSDSADILFEKAANFIKKCNNYYSISSSRLQVPPREIAVIEIGPRFSPILMADKASWGIIFIFNLLVILGLLPIFREGSKFLKKGKGYFAE